MKIQICQLKKIINECLNEQYMDLQDHAPEFHISSFDPLTHDPNSEDEFVYDITVAVEHEEPETDVGFPGGYNIDIRTVTAWDDDDKQHDIDPGEFYQSMSGASLKALDALIIEEFEDSKDY